MPANQTQLVVVFCPAHIGHRTYEYPNSYYCLITLLHLNTLVYELSVPYIIRTESGSVLIGFEVSIPTFVSAISHQLVTVCGLFVLYILVTECYDYSFIYKNTVQINLSHVSFFLEDGGQRCSSPL